MPADDNLEIACCKHLAAVAANQEKLSSMTTAQLETIEFLGSHIKLRMEAYWKELEKKKSDTRGRMLLGLSDP